jgi:hypothetical protein
LPLVILVHDLAGHRPSDPESIANLCAICPIQVGYVQFACHGDRPDRANMRIVSYECGGNEFLNGHGVERGSHLAEELLPALTGYRSIDGGLPESHVLAIVAVP